MAKINLDVNGRKQVVDVDPNTPVLWVLRDHLDLVGTKYGCGIAQCGACTIHLDGNAVRSCMLPVSQAENKKITTICIGKPHLNLFQVILKTSLFNQLLKTLSEKDIDIIILS